MYSIEQIVICFVGQPPVRQEACQGLYRLCLGRCLEGGTGYQYLLSVLANLLDSLVVAQNMKPPRSMVSVGTLMIVLYGQIK